MAIKTALVATARSLGKLITIKRREDATNKNQKDLVPKVNILLLIQPLGQQNATVLKTLHLIPLMVPALKSIRVVLVRRGR